MPIAPNYRYYVYGKKRRVKNNRGISTAPYIEYQPSGTVARGKNTVDRHILLNYGKSKEASGYTRENIRALLKRKEGKGHINRHKRNGK